MERTHNGHQSDREPTDIEFEARSAPSTSSEQPGNPSMLVAEPLAPDTQPEARPARSLRKPVIRGVLAAVLGIGAIGASFMGYRWWQFATTHEETENAAVAAHTYQISSRINGTVLAVPVEDNQVVQTGQLLVQLDPHDYEVKVQQAQAALVAAQRQAEAANANIALSGETT